MKRPLRFASVAALAALALAWSACNLQAGVLPLYSWESGLEGWSAANATLAKVHEAAAAPTAKCGACEIHNTGNTVK